MGIERRNFVEWYTIRSTPATEKMSLLDGVARQQHEHAYSKFTFFCSRLLLPPIRTQNSTPTRFVYTETACKSKFNNYKALAPTKFMSISIGMFVKHGLCV